MVGEESSRCGWKEAILNPNQSSNLCKSEVMSG